MEIHKTNMTNKISNQTIQRTISPNNNLNNHKINNKPPSQKLINISNNIKIIRLFLLSLITITMFFILLPSAQANPSYIPDPFTGEIIAIMTDDGKLYFPVWDLTEYKLYDEGGNLVYSQKYTPFGEVLSSFGTNPVYWTPQGFQDPDTDINMDIAVSTLDAVLSESADPPYDTSIGKFLQDWGTIAVKDAPKNVWNCGDAAKDYITEGLIGTCYAIAHPLQTFEGLATQGFLLYEAPGATLSGYGNAALTAIKEGWDDPRFLGRRSVDVFGLLSGTKLVKSGAASQAGKASNTKQFILYAEKERAAWESMVRYTIEKQKLKDALGIIEQSKWRSHTPDLTKIIKDSKIVQMTIEERRAGKTGGFDPRYPDQIKLDIPPGASSKQIAGTLIHEGIHRRDYLLSPTKDFYILEEAILEYRAYRSSALFRKRLGLPLGTREKYALQGLDPFIENVALDLKLTNGNIWNIPQRIRNRPYWTARPGKLRYHY